MKSPDEEKAKLATIACRACEPGHDYATDEDCADMGFAPFATDPLACRFDMSSDPLAFAKQRGQMIRVLFNRLEEKSPRRGESYQDTRRKFERLLGGYLGAFRVASRYVAAS